MFQIIVMMNNYKFVMKSGYLSQLDLWTPAVIYLLNSCCYTYWTPAVIYLLLVFWSAQFLDYMSVLSLACFMIW
jgi:hypothetical protein